MAKMVASHMVVIYSKVGLLLAKMVASQWYSKVNPSETHQSAIQVTQMVPYNKLRLSIHSCKITLSELIHPKIQKVRCSAKTSNTGKKKKNRKKKEDF